MDQLEMQKQMRTAMNGRTSLLLAGIFMVFTAVTGTLMYGFNFFAIAQEAVKGTAEYVEALEGSGISIGLARGVGVGFLVVGVVEIFAGVFAVRLSNRVDKSAFTVKLSAILLAVEIAMQILLFFTRLMNIGLLLTAIVVPLTMLWGATRLRKLAKADPKRVYAVETDKTKGRTEAARQAPAPKKSVHDRAMMQARLEEEENQAQPQPETEGGEIGTEAEKTGTEGGKTGAEGGESSTEGKEARAEAKEIGTEGEEASTEGKEARTEGEEAGTEGEKAALETEENTP